MVQPYCVCGPKKKKWWRNVTSFGHQRQDHVIQPSQWSIIRNYHSENHLFQGAITNPRTNIKNHVFVIFWVFLLYMKFSNFKTWTWFLEYSPVVIIALTKVFSRTVPSKIQFPFPWNPYLKTDVTSLLIPFFDKDFKEKEIFFMDWFFKKMITNGLLIDHLSQLDALFFL